MKIGFAIGSSLLALSACAPATVQVGAEDPKPSAQSPMPPKEVEKNRLIVLSDIEADPDDAQSFVRLFLYANDIDIEGIIATTSVHQKTEIRPESIHEILSAYRDVHQTLTQHDPDFPTPETLGALVKSGSAEYGLFGVGEGKDTEGSDWIIAALEAEDDRPLWVSVWGGPNTLAQALYKIRSTRTPEDEKRLTDKLRVYTISDQDDSAIWIRKEFPDIFYIVSPGGYGNGTWMGISTFISGYSDSIKNTWFAENIQQGHGPLGTKYPDTAYGYEGDTPAYLSLIPNGLNTPEHPNWGGWGGRYALATPALEDIDSDGFTGGVPVLPEPRPIWTNASDKYTPWKPSDFGRVIEKSKETFDGNRVTLWRWRDAVQNDFAARMDWTVSTYAEANHPPLPKVKGPKAISVASGEVFRLDASDSVDPDGDSLTYHWFNYPEAGTLETPFGIEADGVISETFVTAPTLSETQTGHIILKVTDRGTPPLTRYARIIVTVEAE